MKSATLILGIPIFVLFSLAVTLDLGTFAHLYPDYDLTPYLTARSLSQDFDLAYSRTDSDRYFREELQRPAHFFVEEKKRIFSSGDFRTYAVFYCPDLYVFALAPFVKFFRFHGVLLFHALLIALVYILGYLFYRDRLKDARASAANSVLYHSLILLPILCFLPSHHLFLFTAIFIAIDSGLRNRTGLTALMLAIAFSCNPWSLLFGLFLISVRQASGSDAAKKATEGTAEILRFLVILAGFVLAVWGIERLMYPPGAVSEARWVGEVQTRPLAEVWNNLPKVEERILSAPDPQRLVDFLFGRSVGFFLYGFTACSLLLSSIWIWRSRLVIRGLLFAVLFLMAVCFAPVSAWGVNGLASDFCVMLCVLPFFLTPLIRPQWLFFSIVGFSFLLLGPLLINPMGALVNRLYYLQSFPYRFFPTELSLVGKAGLTGDPNHQIAFPNGKAYFLNDNFNVEGDFFWVHGESSLEFLIQEDTRNALSYLKIQNGSLENRVRITLGDGNEEFRLAPADSALLDLSRYASKWRAYHGHFYLHGKIESGSGYTPKLLSRDNPDYRYLGCQIHFVPGTAGIDQ